MSDASVSALSEQVRIDCDECDIEVAQTDVAERFHLLLAHRRIAHGINPTDPERLAEKALEALVAALKAAEPYIAAASEVGNNGCPTDRTLVRRTLGGRIYGGTS